MQKTLEIVLRKYKIVFVLVLLTLMLLAWHNKFVQDDAFISFRYAKNFAEGIGLVFNKGERVEGYTNFLWTMLMSLSFKLGFDPVLFSYYAGITFFVISLLFTYKIAEIAFDFWEENSSKLLSLLVVILLGTNYTFSAYATGGLETQMQTAFVTASVFFFLNVLYKKKESYLNLFFISLLLIISVLVRPDSLVFVFLIFFGFFYLREERNTANKILVVQRFLVLLVPFLTVLIAYLLWKLFYYGDILPNSFYTKVGGIESIPAGLIYIGLFFSSYWLFPILILFPFYLNKFVKKNNTTIKFLSFIIVVWLLYLVKIGGDFMEFRFLVPILPFLFVVIVWTIYALIEEKKVRYALIVIIILGSIYHKVTFHYLHGIESIKNLAGHLYDENQNWIEVGKRLHELFPNRNVTIAVSAAGAVPFYSELPAVDMYGINDSEIAKNGIIIGNRPGHQKFSTIGYLYDKRVNLLIGEPFVVKKSFIDCSITEKMFEDFFKYRLNDLQLKKPRLLRTSLDSGYDLYFLYLIKNTRVDSLINEGRIRVIQQEKFSAD
ncbi:hypothetical protein ABRY23_03780 [Melioribacteraceae bacterium 4301-Me]|uniref:hypothetical protein n=1 Tax=Pyranulibacter aquaticus TaxID=3163344 RepID=UPI00359BB0E4